MNINQLKRSAAETTRLMLEDLEILLDTKDPVEIWNHPEKWVAFDIVGQYRHKSPKTVKIRVQTLNDLIHGKSYNSIHKAAHQYVVGAIRHGALTEAQEEAVFTSLSNPVK